MMAMGEDECIPDWELMLVFDDLKAWRSQKASEKEEGKVKN